MKKLFFFVFLLLWTLPLCAQNFGLTVDRDDTKDDIADLKGNYGVKLLSKYDDLNILSPNVHGISVESCGLQMGNVYQYIVSVPRDFSGYPKLVISRPNSLNQADLMPEKELLKPNYLIAYRVAEDKKPIELVPMDKLATSLSAKEAVIVVETQMKDLAPTYSAEFWGEDLRLDSLKNNGIKTFTITYRPSKIKELQEAIQKYDLQAKELEADLVSQQEKGEQTDDADWDKLEYYEAEKAKAEKQWLEYSQIGLDCSGTTNKVFINMSEIAANQKKYYMVIEKYTVKKEFVKECSARINEGAELFKNRQYSEARKAYVEAMKAKDYIPALHDCIQAKINLCDSCFLYHCLTRKTLQKSQEMESMSQEEKAKYMSVALEFLQVLYNYNPDPYYKESINELKKILDNIPLNIKFTTVEWKLLSKDRAIVDGDCIPDVELWSYTGDPNQLNRWMAGNKLERFLKRFSQHFRQIGVTNSDGMAIVELQRSELPHGILLYPVNRDDMKPYYMSLDELYEKAQGTYVMKQIRVRMFTKAKKQK